MGIFDFFVGKHLVSTPKKNSAKLVNVCMKSEIEYKNPHFSDDVFIIECNVREVKKLEAACEKRAIELFEISRRGLPQIILKHKKRVGILVGALFTFVMVFFSLNVVWRIDFFGNVNTSTARLESVLSENGFSVGGYIPNLDLTYIENSVMQSCPDIAWVSVNLNGVVANVEIKEKNSRGLPKKDPADLVSVRDGKIERIEVYNGNCLVKVGDVVRAGEVLVSGVYQKDGEEIRRTRADGEVLARTVREIFVEIPFKNTAKVYTGRIFSEIYVNFFKNSIKVFANTGNLHTTCDIIYENGKVGLSGFPKLPVGYDKTTYVEYQYENVVLDENEAMNMAFETLNREIGNLSPKIELLEKNIEFEITETAYILKCCIVCIENIAALKELR